MLAFVAALLAAAPSEPVLEASMPWWERISVTIDDKGTQQSCTYQSSLGPNPAEKCDKEMAESVNAKRAAGPAGVYSKLTFERRFSPGPKLDSGQLKPGDKLIGQQVMFLTIHADGSIGSCRVLATSGEMRFSYGCDEASAEQFRAAASSAGSGQRQAFMTMLVYGHQEQIA